MKVLFITHCVSMGGGNFSLLQLMKELSGSPYNIEPLLLAPLERPADTSSIIREAKANGIKCISGRFYQFKWDRKSFMNYVRYSTNIINYWRILKDVKHLGVDIVHSNSSVIDIGTFLSRKLNVKHIWHLREFGDWDFNLKPLFGKFQEKHTYKKGDKFIAISKIVKERFLPFIPREKIEVIYNGLIPQSFDKDILAEKLSHDKVIFCISGSLNHAKRQRDAIEAMDILVKEYGLRAVHLYIMGDGGDRQLLEKFCDEKGLRDYITLTGWVKDVDTYYRKSDVGLMLSTNEGFGRVTIDYMRAGLAIIASDSGANPELIENNETGILFPTGNVRALSKIMAQLVKDSSLRHRLAENAYKFSQTHFISTENTKSVYGVYRSLM